MTRLTDAQHAMTEAQDAAHVALRAAMRNPSEVNERRLAEADAALEKAGAEYDAAKREEEKGKSAIWLVAWAQREWGPDYGADASDMAEPKGEAWRDGVAGMADAKRQLADDFGEPIASWEEGGNERRMWATAYDDEDSVIGWCAATKTEIR